MTNKEISPYRTNAKPITKIEEQTHLDWLETIYIPEQISDYDSKERYLKKIAERTHKKLQHSQNNKEAIMAVVSVIFVACSLTLLLGWKWAGLSDGLKASGVVASILFVIGVAICTSIWCDRNNYKE